MIFAPFCLPATTTVTVVINTSNMLTLCLSLNPRSSLPSYQVRFYGPSSQRIWKVTFLDPRMSPIIHISPPALKNLSATQEIYTGELIHIHKFTNNNIKGVFDYLLGFGGNLSPLFTITFSYFPPLNCQITHSPSLITEGDVCHSL